jgi:hypothetical protein
MEKKWINKEQIIPSFFDQYLTYKYIKIHQKKYQENDLDIF